ncbi:MAG: hypothetical protein IE914_01675 [Thiotrichales bacterium]|nr:hypothetical protein [Thiotrichales bacterium]
MSPHQYHVEFDETSYCVTCLDGTVMQFDSMEDAIEAMREFEQKSFPEAWEKVPPATRYAKQLYYQA